MPIARFVYADGASKKYKGMQTLYTNEIQEKVKKALSIHNSMRIPTLSKIVVNMGIKDATSDKKNIERAVLIITQVTGQKPKLAKARKAISSFRLREGDVIGVVVTMRGKRMWTFYHKLVGVVLPRLRDFHGVSRKSFDGKGNYSLGFSECSVFPEIDPGKIDTIQGLEVTIVTTARTDAEAITFLELLGMPFQQRK